MHLNTPFALIFALSLSVMCKSQNSPAQPEKGNKTTSAQVKTYPTHLEKDRRLVVLLTLSPEEYPFAMLAGTIQRKSKVPLEREEAARELDDFSPVMAGEKMPVRAYMDAVAALVLGRWERTEKQGYRFLVSQSEADIVYGPQNDQERALLEIGLEFLNTLEKLPPQERKRLESGKHFSLNSLSPEMQEQFKRMLDIQEQSREERNESRMFTADTLPQARLHLENKKGKSFRRYFITIANDSGGMGWRINDYEHQKQLREQARLQRLQRAGNLDSIYQSRRFEISQEEAKRLPVLQQRINLDMRDATFPEVLIRLHRKYGIAFACDPKVTFPHRATVHFNATPLGDALDKLTALYPKTEWELRKSNLLIVRCAANIALKDK
jgi:hypothetical protein